MFLFGHYSADLKIHPFSFEAFFSLQTKKGELQISTNAQQNHVIVIIKLIVYCIAFLCLF